VGVDGEFAGGEHVDVWVDGVMFERYEEVQPCCGADVGEYGGYGRNEAGMDGGE
jgi:hypothetical protein